MLFRRNKGNDLAPKDASAAHARGELVLVDVRSAEERVAARVEGSLHVPLGRLAERLDELPDDRRVAFICRSGARSAIATRAASKHGLDAANVHGGIVAWQKAGLPVQTGPESAGHDRRRSA